MRAQTLLAALRRHATCHEASIPHPSIVLSAHNIGYDWTGLSLCDRRPRTPGGTPRVDRSLKGSQNGACPARVCLFGSFLCTRGLAGGALRAPRARRGCSEERRGHAAP
jgi:hypothetical protein